MTLNPKLALKSVASIKTFGAVYKVDTNHAWLLPIDENNRRCKAAGYSGLKDYLIKKGLKLTKWRDTGLIKELVKPNGELMTFDRGFSFSKVDNIKPDSKVNELLRTNSYSIKKEETVLSPKRIRSLSPTLRHTVGHVQLVAQQTDNKIKTSQTSINVYYKMRRSKTLTLLKYEKENNAVPQERNHNAPNTRNAYPLISGKSLTYLPKESLSKNSTVRKSDSVQSSSIVKPNSIRESVSYRKFDRKNNSPATKTFQKPEIHVSRKTYNSTNIRNPRENLPRPSNKRSETQYSSLKVNITNKFVDTPPVGNLECNTTTSTTSTALSMFSARSSIHSFNDEKESVIRIDITASGTESHSKVSPENVGTRLFCTYVAEGRANKNEEIQCNSFNKICNDQTNEKQEENTKKTCTKSEPKMVYLRTSEPAVEVPEHSEQVPNSKTRSVKASPEEQLCSQSEKIPYEPTQNENKQNKNQKDCFESMVSTKESCFEDGGNYLAKPCESSKDELGAVKIIYPMSKGIEQKLEISNATPKRLSSETTAVTLDSSQQNHTSLIDMRCTLNDVKHHLENMRRSLEPCSESSQKEAHTQHNASILHADNDTTTRLTVLENSDGDTNHSWSDCKQKQLDEFEATNSNSVIPKVKDPRFSCFNETFQPVILWDMNNRRTAKKANSIHGVLRLKTSLPKQLFFKIEASNVYSPIIRKLLESPLLTRGICNGLSAAITPTLCYHSQQPKDTKIMLLQDQHEINRTVGQCYRKRISQKEISYKDAETQTQKNFDEIDHGECKIVRYDSPKRQSMEDTLTKIHAEVYVTDAECECQIPDGGMREDSPEIQNFQVDIYDKDEDSDDCSVYEDALELF